MQIPIKYYAYWQKTQKYENLQFLVTIKKKLWASLLFCFDFFLKSSLHMSKRVSISTHITDG